MAETKNKRIQTLIDRNKKKLRLSNWDIQFKICENDEPGIDAEAHALPSYEKASITFYESCFEKGKDLNHIVKHELAHCLTEQMYRYCIDLLNCKLIHHDCINAEREVLTERISRLI
jgi:hypothetical protein